MSSDPEFDVFLCHNNRDKPTVREIDQRLRDRGLKPWLDERDLRPGQPWQRGLEEQVQNIRATTVFVGESGRGPWQKMEIQAFLQQFVDRQCPVIPVLLPGAPKKLELPPFLSLFTWVDLRDGVDKAALDMLEWGITGRKPDSSGAAP